MWKLDKVSNTWNRTTDTSALSTLNINTVDQSAVRLNAGFVSSLCYKVHTQLFQDLYKRPDFLGYYIGLSNSSYTPPKNKFVIDAQNCEEFYTRTLPNILEQNKMPFDVQNSLSSIQLTEVDLASTEEVNISTVKIIDGVKLIEGNTVLLKDQKTSVVLAKSVNPVTYFQTSYEIVINFGSSVEYSFFDSTNGVYTYSEANGLIKNADQVYKTTFVRYGNTNANKQLSPATNNKNLTPVYGEPVEYIDTNINIVKNTLNYQNLNELQLNKLIHSPEYSRYVAVGKGGVILIYQENKTTILPNIYDNDLVDITQTTDHYWIVGSLNCLLKVNKKTLEIVLVNLPTAFEFSNLTAISFYDINAGIVCEAQGFIHITTNCGVDWARVQLPEKVNINDVLHFNKETTYLVGNAGFFAKLTGETLSIIDIGLVDEYNQSYILNNELFSITRINSDLFLVGSSTIISYNLVTKKFTKYYIKELINQKIKKIVFVDSNTAVILADNTIKFTYTFIGGVYTFAQVTPFLNPYSDYISEGFAVQDDIYEITLPYDGYAGDYFVPVDVDFKPSLKPKMLVLEYDLANKLNFYDSNGVYRLPTLVTYNDASSILALELTPQEGDKSWIQYDKEISKQYEFNVEPSVGFEVRYSTLFTKKSNTTKDFIAGDFSTNTYAINSVIPIANGLYSGSPINSLDIEPDKVLCRENVLVFSLPKSNTFGSVGDIILFDGGSFAAYVMINKIVETSNYNYYYFIHDFNENMLNTIKLGGFKVQNLNTFINIDDFISSFNQHPISKAYNLTSFADSITISARYTSSSAYHNLSSAIRINNSDNSGLYDLVYPTSVLSFKYGSKYNLLNFLSNLDSGIFNSDKEYQFGARYISLPLSNNISLVNNLFPSNTLYIDIGSNLLNEIVFGSGYYNHYLSLLENTYVDINVKTVESHTYNTIKALIIDKKANSDGSYSIFFNKKIALNGNDTLKEIDILTRVKLSEISEDLYELNYIQTPFNIFNSGGGFPLTRNKNSTTKSFYTENYLSILLADVDTRKALSGFVYTDKLGHLCYHSELQPTKKIINIESVASYSITESVTKVRLSFIEELPFEGTKLVNISFYDETNMSKYGGCYNILKLSPNTAQLDIDYNGVGLTPKGTISFIEKDPYLACNPIEYSIVKADNKRQIPFEVPKSNILFNEVFKIEEKEYSPIFALFDGLSLSAIEASYSWILDNQISGGLLGLDSSGLVWYGGNFVSGRWFGSKWLSGNFISGDFMSGDWNSHTTKSINGRIEYDSNTVNNSASTFYSGRWYAGNFNGGTWLNGRWYSGNFNKGDWYNGVFNDGNFYGNFYGGIFVTGIANATFDCKYFPIYWVDGQFIDGEFKNGIWYAGTFGTNTTTPTFGRGAGLKYTALWHSGTFINGNFMSGDVVTIGNQTRSSECRFSMWKTGRWKTGNFYGGIAYNFLADSGTIHTGIFEGVPFSMIDIDFDTKKITLPTVLYFSPGDDVYITSNNPNTTAIGTSDQAVKHKILNVDRTSTETIIELNTDIAPLISLSIRDLEFELVSYVTNSTMKAGVWNGGYFGNGTITGGMWVNGIMSNNIV
jgi:hypothetical protein